MLSQAQKIDLNWERELQSDTSVLPVQSLLHGFPLLWVKREFAWPYMHFTVLLLGKVQGRVTPLQLHAIHRLFLGAAGHDIRTEFTASSAIPFQYLWIAELGYYWSLSPSSFHASLLFGPVNQVFWVQTLNWSSEIAQLNMGLNVATSFPVFFFMTSPTFQEYCSMFATEIVQGWG